MLATATHNSHYCTCLGHFGRRDTDRITSIGQGEYISDCNAMLSPMISLTNFNNVNDPLDVAEFYYTVMDLQ